MRIAGLLAAMVLCAASTADGQDWAVKMFTHTSHDFGAVARGAKVEHAFVLENIYEEDVHIESVTSSCGCTNPQVTKPWLKTWERGEIIAAVDTRAFLGRKDATLTVRIDKPFLAEVQLQCHTYIRGDVVVQPGAVQFGNVDQGVGSRQKVSVTYAGRADWRINRVESANPNITAQVTETSRGDNQVSYDLVVNLKSGAPVGYVQDNIVLVTNDYAASAARVPVAVEGIVVPAIAVSPSLLTLGVTEPGKKVTRQLVLKGKTPFRVLSASSDDPRFKLSVLSEAKTLHLVPVTFQADDAVGNVASKLHVKTDQTGAGEIVVPVQVQVVAGREIAKPEGNPTNRAPEATVRDPGVLPNGGVPRELPASHGEPKSQGPRKLIPVDQPDGAPVHESKSPNEASNASSAADGEVSSPNAGNGAADPPLPIPPHRPAKRVPVEF